MSKYKEGDKVRVVRGPHVKTCEGRIGKLVYDDKSDCPYYDFGKGFHGHGPTGTRWCVNDNDVELVPAWHPKVGDKVRVSAEVYGPNQFGKIGKIIKDHDRPRFRFRVSNGNDFEHIYDADDLELLEAAPEPEPETPAFTIGQRVWLQPECDDDELVTIKKIYLTLSDEDGARLYTPEDFRVATDDEIREDADKAEIAEAIKRLKAAVRMPKFEVGAPVTFDHDDDFKHRTGVVSAYRRGLYSVARVCNDNTVGFFEYTERELSAAA